MSTGERGHDTAGLLAMLETAADPDQAGMMSPYAVAGMAQRAVAALSAAEARAERYRAALERIVEVGRHRAGDEFVIAWAALTEGERDG